MKKVFRISVIVLSLFLLQAPYGYSQDRRRDKPKKEAATNEADEDDVVPQEETVPVRRTTKTHQRVLMGVEGGPNVSLLDISGDKSRVSIGGTIGGYADIRMAGQFYVQPGLYYVMNGASDVVFPRISRYALNMRINTVELPVAIAYKTGKPGINTRFTIGVGGYYAYHAGASINGIPLLIGNETGDDIKATEIGIGINVGLELRNGLFFRMKSQRGLTNLQTDPSGADFYTESHAITIGCFLFGKKIWQHRKVKVSEDDQVERSM